MSILAWFRGLFGRPTKKRQIVVSARRYVKMTDLPQRGALKEQDASRMVVMFPGLTYKQTARKLNAMGYLTPRGRKWTAPNVCYWRLSDEERLVKAQKRQEEYNREKHQIKNKTKDTSKNSGLQTIVYNWPKPGQTSIKTARKVATDLSKMGLSSPAIASLMNYHGLLTPKGSKWTAERAQYWSQADETLNKRRQYWRDRDKKLRQPQTVIFRNADLRPRHNGIN